MTERYRQPDEGPYIGPEAPTQHLETWADDIIAQIGHGGVTPQGNPLGRADWYGLDGRHMVLRRVTTTESVRYQLRVMNTGEGEPLACLRYDLRLDSKAPSQHNWPNATMCNGKWEHKAGPARIYTTVMAEYLQTANIVPRHGRHSEAVSVAFWGIAAAYVLVDEEVQSLIDRARQQPFDVESTEYNDIFEYILDLRCGLPQELISRVLQDVICYDNQRTQ